MPDHESPCRKESDFRNAYEDPQRAAAYDELGLGGTYMLVFDKLPELLRKYVSGRKALDFGCGTGRSSRFLKSLGFNVIGVDVSELMVKVARVRDPEGDYRVIEDGDLTTVGSTEFNLVLSAFTFDNIPDHKARIRLFSALGSLLRHDGMLVNIVSTPEMYHYEWVTFSTRGYPGNSNAGPGDVVRIVTTDYSDNRPIEDILWPDLYYQASYHDAGLIQIDVVRPLATGNEGVAWKSETEVAPWAIYCLRRGKR